MFSFNFASKMLNTIMGTEEQPQPGQPGAPGQQQPHPMAPGQPPQGPRPMGGGFPAVRPTPQGPGGSPRPGYGGPPQFSGPRPTPGARPGPPAFGGPQRLAGPGGMPHRFNGPQPPPGAQPPQQRPMPPGQQQPQQQQQQQQPLGMRGPGPMQGQGVGPMRPRGPGPMPSQQPQQQQHQVPPKPTGAVVPDVDLSHLSAEEREMIESVMAKAQQLEQEGAAPAPPLNAALGPGQPGAPRMMRPEDQRQGVDFAPRICPLCRQRDMSGREGPPGQECTECRTMVCKACGGMTPHPETKRPEWTCGNCIKRRRMGPPTTMGSSPGPLGQQSLGPRPVGQFIQPQQPTSQNPAEWDPNRRPSTGGVPGMQLAGSPQQQRWESERESDKLESMEVESWKNDVGQSRKLSSEIMSPPHLTEHQSEELYNGPNRIPIDLDYISSSITTTTTNTTTTIINKDPYGFLSSPQLSPSNSMSTTTTSYLPSTSVEGINRPPSFAEVMRSRSQSVELEKGIMPEQSVSVSVISNSDSRQGSRRASADSFAGFKMDVHAGSYDASLSNNIVQQLPRSNLPNTSTFANPPISQPTVSPPCQASSIDEKANSLMEELSKLQSAVDNTLRRRQRQQAGKPSDGQGDRHFLPRSRSPSPSPTSPVRDRFGFKSPESPTSPFRSPPRAEFHSPIESPDSPEVPGVRKAIVLKEHDLDDYRSSSDEDSGSGSDEERKGMMTSDTFYDHSPGEVYTIPEEEDEGGSPTGGDLVSSLNRPGIQGSLTENGSPRRRLLGQDMITGVPMDQRHTIRPQLRPQRSLDNRLPAVSAQNPQDMLSSQLDQQSQNTIFSNSSSNQLTNQMGRVDNQTMDSQMNVNTSIGVSISNQMSAMSSATGAIPGLMQPQQQLQQTSQQQQQNQLLQHQQQQQQQQQLQQNQQNNFVSSAVSTTTMGYQQQPNQLTMANNNTNMQQQLQQFGSTGADPATSGSMGSTGDWNSNLGLGGQSVQCSSNSVSPLPTIADQQLSQMQPYQQQMNTYNQHTPQQQQQQQQGQQPLTVPMDPNSQQQQQPSLLPQQQTQGMTSAQQTQLQNQLIAQDQLSNQMQFQKSQMMGAQSLQQQTQSNLQQQNAQLQMQQQTLQGNQQQPQNMTQLGQQQSQPLGQLNQMLGQQMGVATSQSNLPQNQPYGTNLTSSSQAQQWPSSSTSQMYDQSGRMIQTSASQFVQGQQTLQGVGPNSNNQQQIMMQQQQHQQQHQQQQQNQQQQQYAQHMLQMQQSHLNQQNLQQHPSQHSLGVNAAAGQVPTSKSSSIGGLLADFSRALGLGTSPRPSPSEDKTEPFPVPSSGVGATGASTHHGQTSYDPYQQQQHHNLGNQQLQHHSLSSQSQQPIQQSAFTPIHEGSLAYLQRQQQQSYLQQQPQTLQSNLGLQGLQLGGGINLGSSSQLLSSSAQQYQSSLLSSQQQQHPQVLTQGGLIAQQQSQGLGVGVVGALSPAQAHMYQQQMALQHQQQHLKKTSRRAHLSSGTGDVRRDGSASTVLIGGQGLAVTPSGVTIGALTPAVVTSLGTFIGGSLLQQPVAVTPLGTPIGTPVGTPRSGRDPCGGDSSDTMSETDSQKSLRMRRKLPCLPPDQEAAPLPSTKKRERHRSQEFRSLSPMRLSSMDGTTAGRSYPLSSLSLSRPSASESNLRKLTMGASDPIPRPGSALGCLQASSVISSVGGKQDSIYPLGGNILSSSPAFAGMNLRTTTSGLTSDLTTTTSVLSGLYPSYKQSQDSWSSNLAELAAALPPDLRHLLNKGSGGVSDHDLSGLSGLSGLTSSLGDTSLNVGSHLPSYMRTLREQLQEERRQLLSEERRRLEALRERDRELGARLDAVTSRAGSEALRSRADLSRNGGAPRSAGASPLLNRKLKGHRRQLSDPKLSLPFSPIQEDGDSELQDFDRVSTGLLRPPYKSYEYESLEDSALLQRPATMLQVGGDWDHSQSYLASSWAAAGGALRETAITSMGGVHEDDEIRNRMSSRMLGRRSSDGEAWPNSAIVTRSPSSSREKRHALRKHRKSRSWHPSPYVSEEEDEEEEDSLSREEKKARIKAEIARRRQQIQERAGLHGELISVPRIPGGISEHERHSVLKSVDQLLRDQYARFDSSSGIYGRAPPSMYHGPTPGGYATISSSRPTHHHHHHHHHSQIHPMARMAPGGHVISPSASEEDRSIERIASTFRSDHDYASMLYDRLGEMSPLATDSESMGSELGAPAAMPLLPDMPTRSRRLLEDLGSAPIGLNEGTRGGASSGQSIKGRSAQSAQEEASSVNRQLATRRDCQSEREKHDLAQLVATAPSIPNQPQRDTTATQWDSSSPGSSNPPSRRSSRSRSIASVASGGDVTASDKSQASTYQQQQQQTSKKTQVQRGQKFKKKYPFPVKKYLLSRDSKDRSVSGNGVGMRIVGGRELPDSGGKLAAYVSRIFPGGLVEHIGGISEGDVVVEWDGHSLGNKTFEEVTSILQNSHDKTEFEVLIRSDFNFNDERPELPGSSYQEYFSGRQSDCGTDVGSNVTDSQSICIAQQNTTDDNESDKSRPAEGTYSSSCTLASDGTSAAGGKSSFLRSSSTNPNQTTHDEEADERFDEVNDQLSFPSSNTSVTTSSAHQSALSVDDVSVSKVLRRHSALSYSELDCGGGESSFSPGRRRRTSVISQIMDEELIRDSRFTAQPIVRHSLDMAACSTSVSGDSRHYFQRTSIVSMEKTPRSKRKSGGYIHLQICHDPRASILYVTVLKAKLSKALNEDGTDHVPVDPYIVCNIYPERVLENQRRTRHVPMCSEPEFHQTMVYPNLSTLDLKEKLLEVCAWNYSPIGEDELFGKVILPLSEEGILDEQPHSYPLRLEDKPFRKRSSSATTATACPGSSRASGNDSIDFQPHSSSSVAMCPLSSRFSLAGGIHKKIKVGKLSILTPGAVSSSSTSFPTDCHGTFCSIL